MLAWFLLLYSKSLGVIIQSGKTYKQHTALDNKILQRREENLSNVHVDLSANGRVGRSRFELNTRVTMFKVTEYCVGQTRQFNEGENCFATSSIF